MRARELLVPVRIVIPEDATVKELDEAIARERDRFPSAVWQAYARALEAEAERQSGYALRKKGLESRQVQTMCGQVKFKRQRYWYADGREPGTFMVFDNRVGLERHQRFTPGAQEVFAQIASLAPSYKCASQIAETLMGASPSDWWIWKRTQEEGKKLRERDREERRSVFRDGELPGADRAAKPFVGIEADSTKIHAWREKGENYDLHMGIVYDGKERVGKKRNRLTNKVATCGVYSPKEFGEDLFVIAQKYHNVVEARAALFSSDGDRMLEYLRRDHFPYAEHQLDWWHVVDRVREAYTWQRRAETKKMNHLIFSNDRKGFRDQLRYDRRHLSERRSKLNELEEYLDPRWEMLFASRTLAKRHPEVAFPPKLRGSGAQERSIGTVVGHRMKWRGMGWTRQGASNIIRVRLGTLGLQN